MKVLFRSEKVRTTSTGMPDGQPQAVDAWFELQLHEGPPDPTTWEGCGQTAAYWWEQSTRLKDPTRWAFRCHDVTADLEAVVPDELVRSLPADARISFIWTRVPSLTPAESQLDAEALAAWLPASGWTRDGETLTKTFRCRGWKSAVAFIDRIAKVAEEVDHHPDVHLERYRNVRIMTTTFATGKLSDADVMLARKIDELADL